MQIAAVDLNQNCLGNLFWPTAYPQTSRSAQHGLTAPIVEDREDERRPQSWEARGPSENRRDHVEELGGETESTHNQHVE